MSIGEKIRLPDDVTMGYIIGTSNIHTAHLHTVINLKVASGCRVFIIFRDDRQFIGLLKCPNVFYRLSLRQ